MRCASVLAILPLALGAAAPSPPAVSAETPVATIGDIVLVSGRPGARALYVMNPSGKNVHRVLAAQRGKDGGRSPSWSPDRRRIAFDQPTDSGQGLHLIGSDGHGLTQLRIDEVYVSSESQVGFTPAWSPNGRWIAYGYGEAGIAIRDLRTGRSRVFRPQRANLGGGFGNPAWAPDSARLAYWSICCDPTSLEWMSLDRKRRGTIDYPWEIADPRSGPDWSPDGRWLATTLGTSIWKVRVTGGRAEKLAAGTDPAWSPDGRHIVFVSTRDGDADLYVMRADGSGERRLTNNSWADIEPDW